MDSARVFRNYLTARSRVDRMNLLPTKQRQPPLQRYSHSYSRLPAGGRLSESLHLYLNRFTLKHNDKSNESGCHCQKTPIKCPVSELQKPRKAKSKCRIKFKQPVLVVRSRPRLECSSSAEAPEVKIRFAKSPLQPGKQRDEPKELRCAVEAKESTAHSCSLVEPTKERRIAFTEPNQAECEQSKEMPEITRQLTTLMQKLEDQLASEKKQKEELNAINNQLKQLSGNVSNLNDKCKQLESEKSKLKLDELRCQSLEESKLCHKPSSICQFCKHQNLPVLSSMHSELFRLMGKRLFTEVALTILLRADNVYHVNMRDLETGNVLGCLLVNEAGIKEANSLGLFQEILTFCVIDVRSSMSRREAIFGGINFEFVRNQRLSAGSNSQRTQLFKDMYNPINNLQADQETSKFSVSQTLLEIGSVSKSQVLSDDEAKYPAIEIAFAVEKRT